MSSAISPPICAVSSSDSFFSSLSLPKSSENPKTSLTPSTQSSNPLTNSPLFDSSVLPYPTLSKPTAASAHDASAGQSVEVTPNPPPYTLPRPALSAEALVPPPSTIIRVRGKLVVVSGTEHAGPVRPDKTTRRARATPYAQDSATSVPVPPTGTPPVGAPMRPLPVPIVVSARAQGKRKAVDIDPNAPPVQPKKRGRPRPNPYETNNNAVKCRYCGKDVAVKRRALGQECPCVEDHANASIDPPHPAPLIAGNNFRYYQHGPMANGSPSPQSHPPATPRLPTGGPSERQEIPSPPAVSRPPLHGSAAGHSNPQHPHHPQPQPQPVFPLKVLVQNPHAIQPFSLVPQGPVVVNIIWGNRLESLLRTTPLNQIPGTLLQDALGRPFLLYKTPAAILPLAAPIVFTTSREDVGLPPGGVPYVSAMEQVSNPVYSHFAQISTAAPPFDLLAAALPFIGRPAEEEVVPDDEMFDASDWPNPFHDNLALWNFEKSYYHSLSVCSQQEHVEPFARGFMIPRQFIFTSQLRTLLSHLRQLNAQQWQHVTEAELLDQLRQCISEQEQSQQDADQSEHLFRDGTHNDFVARQEEREDPSGSQFVVGDEATLDAGAAYIDPRMLMRTWRLSDVVV